MDDVVVGDIKKIIQIDKEVVKTEDALNEKIRNEKDNTQKQIEVLRKNIIDKQAEKISMLKKEKISSASNEAEKIMSDANEKCSKMIKQFKDKKDQIVNNIFNAILANN